MNLIMKTVKKFNFLRLRKSKGKTIPKNMTIGRGSYYGSGCTFIARDGGKIRIGNYCSIAEGVKIINARIIDPPLFNKIKNQSPDAKTVLILKCITTPFGENEIEAIKDFVSEGVRFLVRLRGIDRRVDPGQS